MAAHRIDRKIGIRSDWRLSPTSFKSVQQHCWWPRRRPERMGGEVRASEPLTDLGYGDVSIASDPHEAQLRNRRSVLMSLSDDSLLMPFRQMAGLPAPGVELGDWYDYRADYDYRKR